MIREDIYNMDEADLIELLERAGLEDEVLNPNDRDSIITLLEEQGNILDNKAEVLDDLYNGNWATGANRMLKHNIKPKELAEYVGYRPTHYAWFGLQHMVSITELYHKERRNAL